jgi:plastocyanin
MRIRTLSAVLVATSAVLFAGCSQDSDDTSSGATTTTTIDLKAYDFTDLTGQPTVEIKAVDNNFEPQYAKVSKGTTVNFKNDGRNQHNVISVETGKFKDIETDAFEPGTTVAVSFPEAGVYQYYCSLHGTASKGMNGIIEVV